MLLPRLFWLYSGAIFIASVFLSFSTFANEIQSKLDQANALRTSQPVLVAQIISELEKKTAEKLLVELKSLLEKKPDILGTSTEAGGAARAEFDKDAIATLSTLGYDTQTILRALKDLPTELDTTEQRVEAALRSL